MIGTRVSACEEHSRSLHLPPRCAAAKPFSAAAVAMMGSDSFKKRSSPPHSSSVPLMPSIPMSTISVDASMRLINDVRCDSPHTLFLRMRDKYKDTSSDRLYMEAVKSADFDLCSRARVEVADKPVPRPPSKLEPFNPGKSFRVGIIEHEGVGEDLPMHVSQATHDFEKRHQRRAGRVAQLLQGLSNPKHESKKLNDAFEDGIGEVRRNRFFVELPVLGPYVGHASDWRKPLPMTLSDAEAGRAARLGGSLGDRRTAVRSKAKTWRVEDSVLFARRRPSRAICTRRSSRCDACSRPTGPSRAEGTACSSSSSTMTMQACEGHARTERASC